VPLSVLDSVGIGRELASKISMTSNAIATVPASRRASTALSRLHGKPTLFYFGAEYCPYCGVETWSLIVR
jgi:hypothetical protein